MFLSDTCIEFHCFNILQSRMSRLSCTVKTCKSSRINNPELTFFKIPDILSKKWTEVLTHHKPLAWIPKKHNKICELHFLKSSYSKHGGLSPGAEPTLHHRVDELPTSPDMEPIRTTSNYEVKALGSSKVTTQKSDLSLQYEVKALPDTLDACVANVKNTKEDQFTISFNNSTIHCTVETYKPSRLNKPEDEPTLLSSHSKIKYNRNANISSTCSINLPDTEPILQHRVEDTQDPLDIDVELAQMVEPIRPNPIPMSSNNARRCSIVTCGTSTVSNQDVRFFEKSAKTAKWVEVVPHYRPHWWLPKRSGIYIMQNTIVV